MVTGNQPQPQKPAQEPSKACVSKRKPTLRERYSEIRELLILADKVLADVETDGLDLNNLGRLQAIHGLIQMENAEPPMFR
ncbi:TPA: hypothetical protein ACKQCJ_001133 [Stenotrophomonas maltophilia]|uniref:Uncharacterized protein n=1 Tax=Stenotrophomonas maltophilia TaxID=40324 RepID=A0AAI9CJR9_STEMA|nr:MULTISPECIES: hypothetical protein [Stenotrophomonas]EKU9962508.1 hypothetical protein [Stenotrophomonas maltophilia]EKZ1926526.1 hypothetical protein [Stenotrophomonas maltophilia]ELE7121288.1 hypothetical protein [Stenotrophomonas maltophilia]EMB2747216.1 hypothetical protein [Stenotrophomonas maltophilia]MBH1377238.1 hypothetical protein [Stenotrophomonas maltophilia]